MKEFKKLLKTIRINTKLATFLVLVLINQSNYTMQKFFKHRKKEQISSCDKVINLLNIQNKNNKLEKSSKSCKKYTEKLYAECDSIKAMYDNGNKLSNKEEDNLQVAIHETIAEFVTTHFVEASTMNIEKIIESLFENHLPEKFFEPYRTNNNHAYQELMGPIMTKINSHYTELDQQLTRLTKTDDLIKMQKDYRKALETSPEFLRPAICDRPVDKRQSI